VEELQESPSLLKQQNDQLRETVHTLAGRLEEAVEEMEDMVSKEEVDKMEFMFSDTVTRLSTRVVQLENKHKNNEQSVNKRMDDCGGALDFDALSVGSSSTHNTNNTKMGVGGGGRAAGGGVRGIAQIQSSGRGAKKGSEAGAGTGLVYSASTESAIGSSHPSSSAKDKNLSKAYGKR
jgi:nanoRNase/pAp phosphatase (c-di-AMP/oligoRNAs hydrolase)